MSAPHAREGEVITCENGHANYRLTQDVFLTDRIMASMFKAVPDELADPTDGQEIPAKCYCCDAPFYMEHGRFHFEEGGWR